METKRVARQTTLRNLNTISAGKLQIEICYSSDHSNTTIFELVENIKSEAKLRGLLDCIELSVAQFTTQHHDFIVVIDSNVIRENDKNKVIELLNAEFDKRLYAALSTATKDVLQYRSL
ncbi:MAG: hypothetical protein JEY94_02175 [Melioribacteraceae bacterium]|nr:hypothetical protein [Melioribacteraceae bacterium]